MKKVMLRNLRMLLLMSTGIFSACITGAQDRFSVQLRPGVSFATTELGNADLKTGFGFEVSAGYHFLEHIAAYAGWGWNRFSSDQSFAGADTDFEETGYIFGLQFTYPFQNDLPFGYFLKAGGIYNHIEVENKNGDIIADSGHGLGFQVETGLSFSPDESWRIIPGIKYQTLSRDIKLEGAVYKVDLNYLSVGVSLLKLF